MADTSYFAQTTYTASASQTSFSVGFPALASGDIKLAIDGLDSTAFTISGDLPGGSGTLTYTGTALSGGERVRIYRRSDNTFATLDFQASSLSTVKQTDLDTLTKALLYLAQENLDRRRKQWVDRSASWTVEPDSAQAYAIDTSGGGVTATLPPAADERGTELFFLLETAGDTFTIDPDGSETIAGVASITLTAANTYWGIASDGDEWHVISNT